jgi:diguanylate cyclase
MTQAQPHKDWREKYLDLIEVQESQQRQFDDQLEQLRRALVRVSLAADGADPELDQVLAALREHLKSPEKHNQLYKRLQVVEEAVIAYDDRKASALLRLRQAVEALLEQLRALSPGRSINKEFKTLSSGLKDRLANQQELPQVLQDIVNLQAKIFNSEDFHSENFHGENKPGFIQKFLSGREKGQLSEGSRDAVSDSNRPFGENVAPNVIDELANILSAIEAAIDDKNGLNKLRQQLQQELSQQELQNFLSELQAIIHAAVVGAKQDFSNFLQKTNSQLQDISLILNRASKIADQHQDQHHQFCIDMGDQLQSLQSTVAQASNLEQLKQAVSNQLDNIRGKLAGTNQRPNSLSEQLKDLLNRVEQFEQDAQKTSKILSQQQQKAQTDSLTGLPNREAYQQRLQLEAARWQRYSNPLTLAVVDIDHFKRINDGYGHQAGDRVLKLIAQSLRKNLRETDFIGRYGGEEFVLLLPETDSRQAELVLDKIRETIAATPFHFRKKPVQITLSIGYSEFKETDTDTVVFARADKALYQSKNSGRNCCTET